MITFYWSPRSSATRIYWALEELGIPVEKVKLDLQAGDQRKPEYLALNPNGKVPLIVDDGVPVFESMAILIHLGQRYGQDKGLWPATGAKAHGQALAWVVWVAATLQPIMFRYMTNTQERFPAEARNAKQAEGAKAELDNSSPSWSRASPSSPSCWASRSRMSTSPSPPRSASGA